MSESQNALDLDQRGEVLSMLEERDRRITELEAAVKIGESTCCIDTENQRWARLQNERAAEQQATIERLKNLLREALNALERRQVPDETRNSYENAERVIKRIAAALGEQP